MFREGAEHRTRGACAPHFQLHRYALALAIALFFSLPLAAQNTQPADQKIFGANSVDLQVKGRTQAGFDLLPAAFHGVHFTNRLATERSITNQIYLNGSGVALGDYDGDSKVDIYLCGLDNANSLYRNLGEWRFVDQAKETGVDCSAFASTAAAFADINGDGHLDLLVNTIGAGTRCFLNDGKGKFIDFTSEAGTAAQTGSMSMALGDVDQDGDLDLYVTNYRRNTLRDEPRTRFRVSTSSGTPTIVLVNNRPVTEPDLQGRFSLGPNSAIIEHGEPDVLFLNDGSGRFKRVPWNEGSFLDEQGKPFPTPYDWGLSAAFRDLNEDGKPDLYVCNDFESPDRLWLNKGGGVFQLAPRHALQKTSLFSMGIDFADIDRDGDWDFFVADMLSRDHQRRQVQVGEINPMGADSANLRQVMFNTLQINRGDMTFAEVAYFSQVEASEWSWTPLFLDVDLDGYEDLLITNGHERDAQNMDVINEMTRLKAGGRLTISEELNLRKRFPVLAVENVAFRNRGNLKFEDASRAWNFNHKGISHGMALGDLDNDGDLDVAINNLNSSALLLRNETSAPRISVRLRGATANTRGIGATIVLEGNGLIQKQEMICGGRYLSSDDPVRTFAAFSTTNEFTLEVCWPGGKRSLFHKIKSNRLYEISETAATNRPPQVIKEYPSWFEDVSPKFNFSFSDPGFNDPAMQPLLSRQLSGLAGGLSWWDYDGNGFEDLMIPENQRISWISNEKGNLSKASVILQTTHPIGSLLGAKWSENEKGLLASAFLYHSPQTNSPSATLYSVVKGEIHLKQNFPGNLAAFGPVALGDLDGDGDLDAFVGGRFRSGRYPEAVPSLILRFTPGKGYEPDLKSEQLLKTLGLVSGVVLSDLDGDGLAEIVLACDWGSLRVIAFRNQEWVDETAAWGLEKFTGWWNGVTTADFDGDGRLDIAASNWGLNSRYRPSPENELTLYYGDFDQNGTFDSLESIFDESSKKRVPLSNFKSFSAVFPALAQKFPLYRDYADASIADILGAAKPSSASVNSLESAVFLNRGRSFEWKILPGEAQWSPAFGICAADFDLDGKMDLFLAQNFSFMHPDLTPINSGRGLLMKGEGTGSFIPLSATESGIAIDGDQRGAAISDYDQDGRLDLAVTEHSGRIRLFHNRKGVPGCRIKLTGPAQNPAGIGAVIQLVYENQRGPAHEIHAGSGYWSQDSSIPIMGPVQGLKKIFVRWPGGKTSETPFVAGQKEIAVQFPRD